MVPNKTSKVMALYNKLSRIPLGQKIFSVLVSRHAPYFSTIKPQITVLQPNHCECLIKKRYAVQNHIQTVHVIAICNGLEMAMGIMAEASVPNHLRWIPKGMAVNYTAKANTDIRCVATLNAGQWGEGDVVVPVTAYNSEGIIVVEGEIKLWITEKVKK